MKLLDKDGIPVQGWQALCLTRRIVSDKRWEAMERERTEKGLRWLDSLPK